MEERGSDTDEQAEIKEDYESWKNSTPFLYDLVMTHPLEYSSLTVEWLPERQSHFRRNYSEHKLILGTHTSENEPNYLMIAQVHVPAVIKDAYKNPDPDPHYDDSRSDLQGFRCANGKVEIIKKINHDGEVNRARYMPQNPLVIATKTINNGEIYVFDCSKHPSEPPNSDKECRPDLRLKGHIAEGYGLSWSKIKKGYLLSGSDDARICFWDVNATPTRDKTLNAMQILKIHEGIVEDVDWHSRQEYLFGSVGDDKYLHISDLRSPTLNKPSQSLMAHQSEVMSLSFNPFYQWMLATGSTDKTVKIFDLRKLTTALHTFNSHQDEVHQVGWSRKNESLLASTCIGRRLMIWDVSRTGEEQEEVEDGPPELLFVHEGHTSKVSDFSWNLREDWTMASVAEDNILQIWKMAKTIYYGEEVRDHWAEEDQPNLKKSRQV